MPCSITAQTGMVANFKGLRFRKNEGHRKKKCPVSAFACGFCTTRSVASRDYHNLIHRRMSVVSMASKSGKNKHSDTPAYKELYEAFPEALLWKKSSKAANKKSQVPDFVDEEELLKSLELRFESDVDEERTRHYEIMYLIHEDNANEVQEVISMVKDFVEERKGKTWRINDWGMRRLAYKIQKATKANYILMNFEFGAEHINELKNLLDKDERVIRHLVLKRDAAITDNYPPPPAFRSISDEDDVDEYDDQMEGELDEEWEEVVEGDVEYGDLVEGKIEEEIEGDVEDTEMADGYDDQVEGEVEEDWEEDSEELESTEQEDVKQLARR